MGKLVAKVKPEFYLPDNLVFGAGIKVYSKTIVSNCDMDSSYIDLKKRIQDRLGEELNDYLFGTIKQELLSKITELQNDYDMVCHHAGVIGAFRDFRQLVLDTFKENKIEVEWA